MLVGAAGFEPTTTSPPDWCATRLRHAPSVGSLAPGGLRPDEAPDYAARMDVTIREATTDADLERVLAVRNSIEVEQLS